jgi:predicted oxidoreductase (fatty acid repression mutant protein)
MTTLFSTGDNETIQSIENFISKDDSPSTAAAVIVATEQEVLSSVTSEDSAKEKNINNSEKDWGTLIFGEDGNVVGNQQPPADKSIYDLNPLGDEFSSKI